MVDEGLYFGRYPFDSFELPELLAVQVDKGVVVLVYSTSQISISARRIGLESDVVEYWEITPAAYQGACVRLGMGSIAAVAAPVYAFVSWGVLAAIGVLVLAGLTWRIGMLEPWLEAHRWRRKPRACYRLRIWYEQEFFELLFADLEELEDVEDDIRNGMQDVAFSHRIDVSGNGNAINIGDSNTAYVNYQPDS